MSPSEIAFLALGIVLGAAIGAAIVEAVRSRPAPRREVRVTIAPNSVLPRRSATLAAAVAGASGRRMPGSPEDEAWREGHAASFLAAAALGRRSSGMSILDRTRVLSGAPVAAVDRGGGAGRSPRAARPGPGRRGGAAQPVDPGHRGRAGGRRRAGPAVRPGPVPERGRHRDPGPAARRPPPSATARGPTSPGCPTGAPSASRGALGAIAVLEALAAADDEPDAGTENGNRSRARRVAGRRRRPRRTGRRRRRSRGLRPTWRRS